QRQLKVFLERGCFPIHKWCSNSKKFLEHIPEEDREKKTAMDQLRGVNETIKVLGLLWDPYTDILFIAKNPAPSSTDHHRITKREMYSEIVKFFDPLGLVSPVIVVAKLLAQRMWRLKIGWDDPVDDAMTPAVKSTKTHLKRVVGNGRLSFEELTIVLVEIEAVLNSRPLFTISNEPADPLVITPAHYLIGRPLIALAKSSLENVKATRLTRWQHLQLMREHFWRAWSREYLNTMQPRKKNLQTTTNFREGMIVLLHNRNEPPLNWTLGRVTAVYPGKDGLVRAVDVSIGGSTYHRSINKFSVLPIEDKMQSNPSFYEQTFH
uniref:DUF5641 domain-containing protein n=1 Tax=Anopheles funestus TaxID=62324 RepID=A0A182RY88_ANOFN